ncbi:hypothetical protein SAMN05421504_11427 [Amycolatopsis xylanica]|uniref:Uncharacterized protein n=1 Tax=Amycolatopsis xylanica TaxID=589385 RepID=A0A1H3SIG0_9PSEU|nr:hypothetical protein [Amycolatopsis xylanica]SDZ37762.1 hypothetical protein SAMN05421504_11427 [Amycolatopsis xylanica]
MAGWEKALFVLGVVLELSAAVFFVVHFSEIEHVTSALAGLGLIPLFVVMITRLRRAAKK